MVFHLRLFCQVVEKKRRKLGFSIALWPFPFIQKVINPLISAHWGQMYLDSCVEILRGEEQIWKIFEGEMLIYSPSDLIK